MSRTFGPITVDTIDALLDFHRSTFGSARMELDPAAPPAPPADATPPPAPVVPAPPVTPPAPDAPPTWDGKVESLPDDVQKMIRDLRHENGERRTKLTATEQASQEALRALAKAAGIVIPGGDDAPPPDPAALAAQLTTEQQATNTLRREHQVLLSAITAGADHAALLDSRSFLAKVSDLDPAAEDFTTKVDAAIAAALTDNPKLKAVPVAAQSGADHSGGSGEGQHDLDAQIEAATKAGNHQLAIGLKRQKAYAK